MHHRAKMGHGERTDATGGARVGPVELGDLVRCVHIVLVDPLVMFIAVTLPLNQEL